MKVSRNKSYQIVLDQSTSGTKLLLLKEGVILKRYDKKHRQIYPEVGWVEHDPLEIWRNTEFLLALVFQDNDLALTDVASLSITNQRETVVAWDKRTGEPLYNAIVWQCNRSIGVCEEMIKQGKSALIREKTGLKIDPYFSGTKIKWLSEEIKEIAEKSAQGQLAIGTMDSWLIWKLTQGEVFATDTSNACRTLLYNIRERCWDKELIELFGIKLTDLADVRQANDHFGTYQGIVIKGVMADSQAALLGEDCVKPGDVKITMGTGCSVMMQLNQQNDLRDQRILTTIAWEKDQAVFYALEGIIKSCGDAINWFSDTITSLEHSPDLCNRVLSEQNDEKVFFIPALQGLGAPFWDSHVGASFVGMKRTTSHSDLLRAVLESIIFQIKAVIEVMEEVSGQTIKKVYVDGGVSKNKNLMGLLASLIAREVVVSEIEEFSAIGVAVMANEAEWHKALIQTVIKPTLDTNICQKYGKWKRLIEVAIENN